MVTPVIISIIMRVVKRIIVIVISIIPISRVVTVIWIIPECSAPSVIRPGGTITISKRPVPVKSRIVTKIKVRIIIVRQISSVGRR